MKQDQLEILCQTLNLGKPILPVSRVYGGLLHYMWRLNTEKGSFAVKQLSKNIDLNEETRRSYEISENIAYEFMKHGIPAISGLLNKGKYLIDVSNNTFIIYPWINAKTLDKNEVSIIHATKIASLLAKMHLLNLSISELTKPEYDNHIIHMLIQKLMKKFIRQKEKT